MGSLLSRIAEIYIVTNIQNITLRVMKCLVRRSVKIEISNDTRNITLKNPRTHLYCGRCSVSPKPELSPGYKDNCRFPGSYPFWGVAGILVYEAKSFTLAIHFSNPIDYNKFPMELGLELSPDKVHLGRLEDTYARMANGTYSSSCSDPKFDRGIVDRSHGTVQVSNDHVKVMATMSSDTSSLLKVVLEEEGGSGEEAGTRNPCRRRNVQEK